MKRRLQIVETQHVEEEWRFICWRLQIQRFARIRRELRSLPRSASRDAALPDGARALRAARKELGPDAPALHAGLGDLPAIGQIDVIHCIGPLMRSLYDRLPQDRRGEWFAAAEDALPRLKSHLDSGDVVLAKGSLSMKLARIVDGIRKMGHAPLDEG